MATAPEVRPTLPADWGSILQRNACELDAGLIFSARDAMCGIVPHMWSFVHIVTMLFASPAERVPRHAAAAIANSNIENSGSCYEHARYALF